MVDRVRSVLMLLPACMMNIELSYSSIIIMLFHDSGTVAVMLRSFLVWIVFGFLVAAVQFLHWLILLDLDFGGGS